MSRSFVLTFVTLIVTANAAAQNLTLEPQTFRLPGGAEVSAQLGRLKVPENRTRPDSRLIEIVFLRIPSHAAKPAAPLIFLAGGPGNSTVSSARNPEALASWMPLTEIADLILLDQRSSGLSTPRLACEMKDRIPGELPFADRDKTLQAIVERSRLCAEEWRSKRADLTGYNTNESADDLESIRTALGIPKISLLGFSYGTHLALTAIRRHPSSLERVVLIGTEGPNHTLKLPRTSETQFGKLALLAGKDPGVSRDIPDLALLTRQLLSKLDRQPVTVMVEDRQSGQRVPVKVGSFGLRRILAWDIGDGNDFPLFPALMKLTIDGDLSLLTQYVEKRWNQMTRGVFLMPILMDCASGVTADRSARIRSESPTTILGEMINFPFPHVCAALGIPSLDDEFRAPILTEVRTLFISGTMDNNTPPFQAEELRWGFTNGTHLIVRNAGHEDLLPNRDVQRAIGEFLKGEEVSARGVELPTPRFVPLAEARRYKLP